MSPYRCWIALVDVHPDEPGNAEWLQYFGENSSGGFVHVVGLARTQQEFTAAVEEELGQRCWRVAGFDDVETLPRLKAREPLSPAFEEMERQALHSGTLQFGRFFLYPPQEQPVQEWLGGEALDPRLTSNQSGVLANLSRMFSHLELTQLDEGVGLTGQGSADLEIFLPNRDPAGLDLTILVQQDHQVTVDYEYGHVHFDTRAGADWLAQALEFVYSALQGGVRVEIWATGDKLQRSRASILLENGDWHPFAAWSATPDPGSDRPATIVRYLSYL